LAEAQPQNRAKNLACRKGIISWQLRSKWATIESCHLILFRKAEMKNEK